MARRDPWENPDWHAIGREAALTKHLLGAGATALGTANYADRFGDYYLAFFCLCNGIERLGKLILIANTVLESGKKPNSVAFLRKYGHNLSLILSDIKSLQLSNRKYPEGIIENSIIDLLTDFANASKGRYANIESIGTPNLWKLEPLNQWWNIVVAEILDKHYFGKAAQRKVEWRASVVSSLTEEISIVRFVAEDGTLIDNVYDASVRTGMSFVIQKYSRFYVLTIVKWMCEILYDFAHDIQFKLKINGFDFVWEYFEVFMCSDSYFKTKKKWV